MGSSQWDAQALANTAWACSAIAMKHIPLLQSIAAASLRRITEEKSQERSNTAWAFATMELKDWPLMEAISASSLPIITYFDSQGRSNLAWACAQLWVGHKPLMEAISSQARNLISSACQQELANFAWSNWAILLNKPHLLHSALRGFTRLHHLYGPPDGRLVGVEWIHMADCAGTDEDGKCRVPGQSFSEAVAGRYRSSQEGPLVVQCR